MNSILFNYLKLFNDLIVPLEKNSKKPLHKGFKDKIYTENELSQHDGNFCLLLPKNLLVIDVDNRNDGINSWNKLKFDLNLDLKPNVTTPSGGYHIYTRLLNHFKPSINLTNYPGIDFLTYPRQIVIPPSTINNSKYELHSLNIPFLPVSLENLLKVNDNNSIKSNISSISFSKNIEKDKNTLITILNNLTSNLPYDMWLKVLMCIHNLYDGSKEGLDLAKNWSKKDYSNYNDYEIESKWLSFKNDIKAVKLGSVIRIAKTYCNDSFVKEFFNSNSNNVIVTEDMIAYLKGWGFLIQEDKYININTNEKVSKSYFKDTFFNRFKKNVKNILDYVYNIGDCVYEPTSNSKIIYENQRVFLNTYIPPVFDNEPYNEEWVNLVIKHINLVTNEDKNFLYWLIWQIKHPGKIIGWMPILQSYQGVGKSFFRCLLERCLGQYNVGIIPSHCLIKEYTGWAANKCCNVFEELKVDGSERYNALNNLKEYITNDYVSIRKMYSDTKSIKNTCNYLAFTNYIDCLPFDINERRFYPIICRIKNREHFNDIINENPSDYYNRLYNGLKFASSFVKWSKLQVIPPYFYKTTRAPINEELIVNLSAIEGNKFEYLLDIQDIINDNKIPGVNNNYIISNKLVNKIKEEYEHFNINLAKSSLKKLGYIAYPKKIYIKDSFYRIWIRSHLINDIKSIKEAIKEEFKTY